MVLRSLPTIGKSECNVKNSDKVKNDEFLNGFDKAIRGNETEYEA